MRVVFVANHFDVVVGESIDGRHIRVEFELRECHRFSTDLQVGLLKVVAVEVRVTQRVDKGARLEPADLGHHVGEQRIGGDVKRNAKEHIGASLVELTVEFAIRHMELEEGVARHERHLIQFTNIPS